MPASDKGKKSNKELNDFDMSSSLNEHNYFNAPEKKDISIKQIRTDLGLSPKAIGKFLDVTDMTINRWENNKAKCLDMIVLRMLEEIHFVYTNMRNVNTDLIKKIIGIFKIREAYSFLAALGLVKNFVDEIDPKKIIKYAYRNPELFVVTVSEIFELMKAPEEEVTDNIKAFLKKKPKDVNSFSESGHTPLMIAAMFGITEVCKVLLNNGADVNKRKNPDIHQLSEPLESMPTALHYALLLTDSQKKEGLHVGKQESAMILINHGADANINSGVGTAFQLAIIHGYPVELLSAMVDKGASVNTLGRDNMSPLKTAIKYDRMDVADFLVKKGANFEDMTL